jgi:hypothetical protein
MIITSTRSFNGEQSKGSGTVGTEDVIGRLVVHLPGRNDLTVSTKVVYRFL